MIATKQDINIRGLAPSDFNIVIGFVHSFYKEYGGFILTLNDKHLEDLMWRNYKNCLILEVDREIAGVIGGQIVESFTEKGLIFQEILWYVKKGFRQYSAQLLRVLEERLMSMGVIAICMATPDLRMDRFFNRKGYTLLEHHYVKRLQ